MASYKAITQFLCPVLGFCANITLPPPAACNPPSNTVGISFAAGVFNRDEGSIKSTYSCECDEIGVRAYYPTNTNLARPTAAIHIYRGKCEYDTTKVICSGRTDKDCQDFCFCSEDGLCYTNSQPYALIKFIPVCTNISKCHMYATIDQGDFRQENGTIYQPRTNVLDPLNPFSYNIKAASISCNGCDKIRTPPVCKSPAYNCAAPPNSVGIIIDIISYGMDLTRTALPSAKCQCQRRIKWFWESIPATVPPTAKWAYENNQTAAIINTQWGCPGFCICPEEGHCFKKTNTSDQVHLIYFIPYCFNATDCHMLGVVDLTDNRKTIMYENGTLYQPVPNSYNTYLNSTSLFIKVYSISCLRCERPQFKPQCEGATVMRKKNEIMSRYPYVLYNDKISNTQIMVNDILTQQILDGDVTYAFGILIQLCRESYMSAATYDVPRFYDICFNVSSQRYTKNCTKCNPQQFPLLYSQWNLDVDVELKKTNLYLLYFFGVIGIIAALGLFKLVSSMKEMQTSYGILCAILAIVDAMYLLISMILEGGYCLYKIINNEPWRHQLSFIFFYLHISISQAGAILGVSKSLNRTVAVYFPFFYRMKYSKRRLTIYISLTFIFIFFGVNIPILCQEDNRNFFFDIEFNDITNTAFLKFYWNFYFYTDYVAVSLSFLFDIATAARLWFFFTSHIDGKWTKDKIVAEFLLLLQNFSNVALFGLQLIPSLFFGGFCGNTLTWRRNCYDTTFKQMLVILYYYNARRAIWRTFDEIISFFIQYRIFRNTVKK